MSVQVCIYSTATVSFKKRSQKCTYIYIKKGAEKRTKSRASLLENILMAL